MAPAERGHLGHQLGRLIQRTDDIAEHLHQLGFLREHIGCGEEPARPRIELEQSIVEVRADASDHGLEPLPAFAHQFLLLGCHATSAKAPALACKATIPGTTCLVP